MLIAVDAMGGDYGASAVCPGAIEACRKNKKLEIALVGDKAVIDPYLDKAESDIQKRISVVHTEAAQAQLLPAACLWSDA